MDTSYAIVLTRSQLINLSEFIEFHFIDSIRNDDTIDNIDYLVDMCSVYKQMADILSTKGE